MPAQDESGSAAVHTQSLRYALRVPVCRPDHKEEQLRAQKQHSLPETSPGKSPAGSGAFTPFRGLSALRARLGSPLGSPLQHASPSQAASPSSSSHRDHPEDLSSDHVHQSVHASSLRAAESSPDGSEQATHVDGASRGADDTRWASSTQVCLWQTAAQQQSCFLFEAACPPPPTHWHPHSAV